MSESSRPVLDDLRTCSELAAVAAEAGGFLFFLPKIVAPFLIIRIYPFEGTPAR
jgi:hypothetical protein